MVAAIGVELRPSKGAGGKVEVLSSRVLLRTRNLETTLAFYGRTLGLHVYREWGSGDHRGMVFFLGGGFLEVSGRNDEPPDTKIELWLQVRDVDATHRELEAAGVSIIEAPADKPWGLREMRVADPEGVHLVIVQVPHDHPLRRRRVEA